MKKLLKSLVYTILAIVAIGLVLVLTLPLWVGPVVKPLANSVVPKCTKTSFHMGHLSLNPYTGRCELGDVRLGNPQGYSEQYAFAVSNIVVDLAMNTVADKYVHVEEVTVSDLFLSYLSGGENEVDNITQIEYNVAGGKEKYEANKAKKAAEEAEEKAKLEKMSPEERKRYEAEREASETKVVIDKLTIGNVTLVYRSKFIPVPITIPIPFTITLTDIGKESDGVTFMELCDTIVSAILKSASKVSGKAIDFVGDAASFVGDSASKLGTAVSDGAGRAVDAVSDGAGKLGTAVSDGAGKAVDAVSDGAGKAVDAVSDGAGKAVDAVKGLFN